MRSHLAHIITDEAFKKGQEYGKDKVSLSLHLSLPLFHFLSLFLFLSLLFYFFLACTLLSVVFMPFYAHWPIWNIPLIMLIIGISGGLWHYCLTLGFQRAPASVLAPFNYTGLLWATLFDIMLWGYVPGLPVYLGATLIIAAQLYLFHPQPLHAKKARSAMPPPIP